MGVLHARSRPDEPLDEALPRAADELRDCDIRVERRARSLARRAAAFLFFDSRSLGSNMKAA